MPSTRSRARCEPTGAFGISRSSSSGRRASRGQPCGSELVLTQDQDRALTRAQRRHELDREAQPVRRLLARKPSGRLVILRRQPIAARCGLARVAFRRVARAVR